MKRKKFNKKGFTLLELIIVVVIMAILVGLSAPRFNNRIKDANVVALTTDLDTISSAGEDYYFNNGKYPVKTALYTPSGDFVTYLDEKIDRGPFHEVDMSLISSKISALKNKGTFIFSDTTKTVYYPQGVENRKGEKIYESVKDEIVPPLRWLEKTQMIVTNSNFGGLSGVPLGGVLWNYDADSKTFSNYSGIAKISMLSVTTTLDSTIEAYKKTNNQTFYNNAKLMGDYIIANTMNGTVYGQPIKFVVTQRRSSNSWDTDYEEVYSQDISYSAYVCFKLYEITREDKYKNNAIDLMNTLNYSQDLLKGADVPAEIKGNFFTMYSHTSGTAFSPSWNSVALDNVDMIVNAYTEAYKVTKNEDYNSRLATYKTSVLSILQSHGGINPNGFVYEYYADRGDGWKAQNYDQLGDVWGTNAPFTTDQYFYCLLGVSKLDSQLALQLYNKAKTLPNNNLFYGQYNINGTLSYDKFEIINTGLYLELTKRISPGTDTQPIKQTLLDNIYATDKTDINSYNAYEWSTNTSDNVIESIATGRIIKALLR